MCIQQPAQGTGPAEPQPRTEEEHNKDRRAAAETEVAAYDADESRAPTAEVDARRTQEIASAEVGVVGMAVMGSSLARNLARHEYRVALFNRTYGRTQQVVSR
jgi:6-phosphogluconate dehydrogenase